MANGETIKVGPGGSPDTPFRALQGARTVFTVADFDQDGIHDLVVGDTYGIIRYYKNVGTRDDPVFALPVQVGEPGSRLMVDATDWNQDGRTDIIAGASSGEIRVYFNVGNAGEARFAEAQDPGFPPIIEPRTIMADLNEDGDEDAFIPSTLGSCFVERSFLKHGYARGHILRLEKKEEKRR